MTAPRVLPGGDVDGVVVMPIDEKVLGFSNRWYPAAIDTAQVHRIAGHDVRVVTPALFLATKLEAFRGRGRRDVYASHDLEDIVTVIDGRPEIVADVDAAASEIGAYIASAVSSLLHDRDFVEALPGFLHALSDLANH